MLLPSTVKLVDQNLSSSSRSASTGSVKSTTTATSPSSSQLRSLPHPLNRRPSIEKLSSAAATRLASLPSSLKKSSAATPTLPQSSTSLPSTSQSQQHSSRSTSVPVHGSSSRTRQSTSEIYLRSVAADQAAFVSNPTLKSTASATATAAATASTPTTTTPTSTIPALSRVLPSAADKELLSSATANALAVALGTSTANPAPLTSGKQTASPLSSSSSLSATRSKLPLEARTDKLSASVATFPELKSSRSDESVITRQSSLRLGRLRQSSPFYLDRQQSRRRSRALPSLLNSPATPDIEPVSTSTASSLPSKERSTATSSRHQDSRAIGTQSLQQQQQQKHIRHESPAKRPAGAAVTAAGAAVRNAREKSVSGESRPTPGTTPRRQSISTSKSLSSLRVQQTKQHFNGDGGNTKVNNSSSNYGKDTVQRTRTLNGKLSKSNLHNPHHKRTQSTTQAKRSTPNISPPPREVANLKGDTRQKPALHPRHHSSSSSLSSLISNRLEKGLKVGGGDRSHREESPQPPSSSSGSGRYINSSGTNSASLNSSSHQKLTSAANTAVSATSAPARPSSSPKPAPYPSSSKAPDGAELSRNMHQTSSRLLRMTEDERPFTRDFNDLFSTLMVSLPLASHRVRFQKVEHTFTSEEAITNLGSLKFSQSNRMPDPKDQSRIVTTTTTTTFSMAKEMAKSVCQRFLEARFIESVDGATDFGKKSSVWQLTPKGMHILQSFCQRNGIAQRHVFELLESPRNTMHLVTLERDRNSDRLNDDAATTEVIFRRFAGQDKPNQKASTSTSDSDSLHEYSSGLVGVKVAKERKVGDKIYYNTFTGKAAVDWLMDCSTVVDKRETYEIATLFIEHGLMSPAESPSAQQARVFQPTKSAIYYVTEKGQRCAGWISTPRSAGHGGGGTINAITAPGPNNASAAARRGDGGATRDSNANRMAVVCSDPALRLLFREFLKETHCEENLSFYLDVKDFLASYEAAKRSGGTPKLEVIRETLAAAYSLYNAFLAPGSPCELNIDHSLRTALAGRMTRAVGDDEAMIKSLDEVAVLFDQAQNSVFKLMASDSVPKFMRDPKYTAVLRERNFDSLPAGPLGSGGSTSGGVGRL